MSEQELSKSPTSDRELRNLKIYTFLFSAGLPAGALMNTETAKWYRDSMDALRKPEDDPQPPKPPRRPNARIGNIALGNT